jgi:hypothetical protein
LNVTVPESVVVPVIVSPLPVPELNATVPEDVPENAVVCARAVDGSTSRPVAHTTATNAPRCR